MADQAQTEENENEPEGIKQLREQARQASELQKQLDAQKRELAFAKAGVDTESKLGSMLFKTFDGDLSSDAIQAEAKEIGLLKTEQASTEGQQPLASTETQQTDQRQQLASGSLDDGTAPGQTTGEDPQLAGIRETRERLKAGEAPDNAFQSYVQHVVQAAVDGDQRVLLPQE